MSDIELVEPTAEEFQQYVETDMTHWGQGVLLGKKSRGYWWNVLDNQIPEWSDDRAPEIEDLKIVLQYLGLRFHQIHESSIQWGGSEAARWFELDLRPHMLQIALEGQRELLEGTTELTLAYHGTSLRNLPTIFGQ